MRSTSEVPLRVPLMVSSKGYDFSGGSFKHSGHLRAMTGIIRVLRFGMSVGVGEGSLKKGSRYVWVPSSGARDLN